MRRAQESIFFFAFPDWGEGKDFQGGRIEFIFQKSRVFYFSPADALATASARELGWEEGGMWVEERK